jgi:MFS family permease
MYSSVHDRPVIDVATSAEADRPRIGRNVWFLGLTSLFTDISSEMVNAILPLYLMLQVGFSPISFGVFDGAYQGMPAVLRIVGGLLADRHRRYKEVAAAGYAFSALAKLGLLAARASAPITGVLLLDRTGKGVRTAPRDALISLSSAPSRMAESFGVHRALDTVGALLGPLLAFHLLSRVHSGYDVIFVFSFCIALIGLAILCFFVKNRTAETAASAPAPPLATPAGAKPSLRAAARLLRLRAFRRLVVVGAGLGLVTVSDAFIYLVLQRRSSMESSAFPLLFVGTALAYLLLAVPAGRLADRIGRAPVFLAGYVLLAGCYVVLGHVSGSGLGIRVLLLGLLGAYYASTDGVLMAMASTTVPEQLRSSGLALLTTVTSTARLGASIVFGLLWTWRGTDSAVACFLVALAVALPISAVVLSRNPPGGPGVSPEVPGGPGVTPEVPGEPA